MAPRGGLLLLQLQLVRASQERYPDPAPSCHDDIDCRESMSGGVQCRDTEACTHRGCGEDNIARRAGHTCKGWPGYNGGYPMSKLQYDSEREFYECGGTETQYCNRWLMLEIGVDEWEAGSCDCLEVQTLTSGRNYCHKWKCLQIEVDKCKHSQIMISRTHSRWHYNRVYGSTYTGPRDTSWMEYYFPGWNTSYVGEWTSFPYQCLEEHSDDTRSFWVVVGPEVETETTNCECTETVSGGGTCSGGTCGTCTGGSCTGEGCRKWKCIETDDSGHSDAEHEYYEVTEFNGPVVKKWSGNVESRSEFEVNECFCVTDNGNFCTKWECDEDGFAYFYPNLVWVILHWVVSLLTGWILCLPCALILFEGGRWQRVLGHVWCECDFEDDRDESNIFLGIIVTSGMAWCFLFVWIGGIAEFVIFWTALPAVIFCCVLGLSAGFGWRFRAVDGANDGLMSKPKVAAAAVSAPYRSCFRCCGCRKAAGPEEANEAEEGKQDEVPEKDGTMQEKGAEAPKEPIPGETSGPSENVAKETEPIQEKST